MAEKKRYTFLNLLAAVFWILIGAGTIVLLVAAIKKKESKHCKAVDINISGVQNNFFIDKKDVIEILKAITDGKLEGRTIHSFNLAEMESALEKNHWIKDAELFFDNNEVLKVRIIEREPIARVFTTAGSSFYIDTSVARLPLGDKFSARLPVFTNYPSGKNLSSKADSSLLIDVKNIGEFIMEDPFWMAQIEQVDITADRNFEMIPKIGNQVIIFGNADNYRDKFNNLLLFYKKVQSKVGWDKYSTINIQYNGQVVCVKRGAADIKMDSLKVRQLMQTLVANAQKQANDSLSNIQLVQQPDDNSIPLPPQTDEDTPDEEAFIYKKLLTIKDSKDQMKDAQVNHAIVPEKLSLQTAVAPGIHNNIVKSILVKPISNSKKQTSAPIKKTIKPKSIKKQTEKPKAIMPPANDY